MNIVEELKAACQTLQASYPGNTVSASCEVIFFCAGLVEVQFKAYSSETGFRSGATLAEAVEGIVGINRVESLLALAEDLERQASSIRAKAKAEAEGGAK